jgi:molybdopterin/thiamine biosynthesis adenylyltransferase
MIGAFASPIAVITLPKLDGSCRPLSWLRRGLGSKVSRWLGPPSMNRKITRLAVPATVGSFAALLAINAIVGVGDDPSGRLHLFDGAALRWREIRIPADPACRACGQAS